MTAGSEPLALEQTPGNSGAAYIPASTRERVVVLLLFVWLAIFGVKVFIAAEVGTSGFPLLIRASADDGPSTAVITFDALLLCCLEDLAVALLFAAAVSIAPAAGRWRRPALAVAVAAAAGALAWMVVSAQVYCIYRRFLSFGMFQSGGGLSLHPAVGAYATPGMIAALVLLPALVPALALLFARFAPGACRRIGKAPARPWFAVPMVAALFAGGHFVRRNWLPGNDSDFARNAHRVFVGTWLADAFATGSSAAADASAESADVRSAFQPGQPHHPPVPAKSARNILLVVWDAVGVEYLEPYGSLFPTTPNLSRLAGRGLLFDNFHSNAAGTWNSGVPMFGGILPDPRRYYTLKAYPDIDLPHAADRLRGQGFRTFFVGSGYKETCNFGRALLQDRFEYASDGHRVWSGDGAKFGFAPNTGGDGQVLRDAVRILRDIKPGERFFLTMWGEDAHPPFREGPCPVAFDESKFPPMPPHHAVRFRNMLRGLWRSDFYLAELQHVLEETGLADSTMLVVTADHGHAWGRNGVFGYVIQTYQDVLHVPLLIIGPGVPPGRSPVLGSHVDLWPTLMHLCGLPADPLWQGRDLLGDYPAHRRRVYYCCEEIAGVRDAQFKYQRDAANDPPSESLYDLLADPHETRNLAASRSDVRARLSRETEDWVNFQSWYVRSRIGQKAK